MSTSNLGEVDSKEFSHIFKSLKSLKYNILRASLFSSSQFKINPFTARTKTGENVRRRENSNFLI